jgi:quercetin dioxygenase-like cupin family protein
MADSMNNPERLPDQSFAIHTTFSDHTSGGWISGRLAYFEYRDLGLNDATNGLVSAQVMRLVKKPSSQSGWHCHPLDFQFFYVLKGSIRMLTTGGGDVTLGPASAAYHPPFFLHNEVEYSNSFEVIHITAPPIVTTIEGRKALSAATRQRRWEPVYFPADSARWTSHAGSGSLFQYRDLPTGGPMARRVHMRVARATKPSRAGIGYEDLMNLGWFVVLAGSAAVQIEGASLRLIHPGDALSVGSEPASRNSLTRVSSDFTALQMTTLAP